MARARKTKAGSYEVTERQAQVLETIHNHLMLRGFPPTRAEIGRALGLRHQSAVDNHLHALAKKKYLELSPGVERGIRLLRVGVPLYEPKHFRRGSTADVGSNTEHGEPVWLNYPQLWPVFGSTPDVCMRVRDRDMEATGLTEGSIIALRLVRDNASAEPAQDGDVVAARVRNQIMVRRYRIVNDETAELHPESGSPEHRTVTISPETEDVEIIGVVIGRMLAGGG